MERQNGSVRQLRGSFQTSGRLGKLWPKLPAASARKEARDGSASQPSLSVGGPDQLPPSDSRSRSFSSASRRLSKFPFSFHFVRAIRSPRAGAANPREASIPAEAEVPL